FISELAVRVRDGNTRVGIAAAQSLKALALAPEQALRPMGRALSTHHLGLQAAVLDAIDAYGKDAVSLFLDDFEKNPDEGQLALICLVAERRPDDYVPLLGKMMTSHDRPKVRERAAQVLARLGPLAKKAKSDLLAALDHKEGAMRIRVLDALGRTGDSSKAVVEKIQQVLADDDRVSVRYSVRVAFERLGIEWVEEEEEEEL